MPKPKTKAVDVPCIHCEAKFVRLRIEKTYDGLARYQCYECGRGFNERDRFPELAEPVPKKQPQRVYQKQYERRKRRKLASMTPKQLLGIDLNMVQSAIADKIDRQTLMKRFYRIPHPRTNKLLARLGIPTPDVLTREEKASLLADLVLKARSAPAALPDRARDALLSA